MNLGISRNVSINTIASANATAGLNVAMAVMQEHLSENGELPASLTLPTFSGQNYSPSYSLSSYSLSGNTARISMIGEGSQGDAEYEVEALVGFNSAGGEGTPGDPQPLPFLAYGLSSESIVTSTGSVKYWDVGIHGNQGFTFSGSGSLYQCGEVDSDGTCLNPGPFDGRPPVSASAGATTCSLSGSGMKDYTDLLCSGDVPHANILTEPVALNIGCDVPEAVKWWCYPEEVSSALEEVSSTAADAVDSSRLGISCDYLHTSDWSISSNKDASEFYDVVEALSPGATI